MAQFNDYILGDKPVPEKSVLITFDDGYISQYKEALPILQKYGFKATFFLYMDCIDKYPVCMNSLEIKEIVKEGHLLGNHTLRHSLLTNLKDNIIEKEIIENQKLLEEKFGKENVEKVLAYPYGAQNERVIQILQKLEYLGAVGVIRGSEKNNQNIFNLYRYLIGDNFEFFLELF